MKYLDLFTGIGGFTYGIEKAFRDLGHETTHRQQATEDAQELVPVPERNNVQRAVPRCIGYSEIDKYASAIYQSHYPTHHNYGDITKIEAATLPDFDLLVGGFPCQAFSIAGKRLGFDDTRGTLFFDVARILKEKRPRHFVLENVKGLLSHDGGRTFKTIISALAELGYGVEWQVLNSKDFGVPQNRERVYIVGHLGGLTGPKVFPIPETGDEIKEINVVGDLFGGAWDKRDESSRRVYGTNGVSPTIPTCQGGGIHPKILEPFVFAERGRYKEDGTTEQKVEPRFDGVSNTLTSVEKDNRIFDGRIRKITPTECERLQGFPDGWTASVSDTQRYKCLGNAVTTNVVEAVIRRLYDLNQ